MALEKAAWLTPAFAVCMAWLAAGNMRVDTAAGRTLAFAARSPLELLRYMAFAIAAYIAFEMRAGVLHTMATCVVLVREACVMVAVAPVIVADVAIVEIASRARQLTNSS